MNKKRRMIKRKYKRLATAIAGAAIMSSALLPGIPAAIAHAAPAPAVVVPPGIANAAQTIVTDTITTCPNSDVDADAAVPTPDVTADTTTPTPAPAPAVTADATTPTPAPAPDVTADTTTPTPAPATVTTNASDITTNGPLQVAVANAGRYGLDANGRYSLLSQTDSKAIVRVRSNGQTYKVDLVLRDGNWVVQAIRGIGDARHPATYVTANSYYDLNSPAATNLVNQVTTTVAATLGASQQVIYQNNNYDNWSWNENAYPQDMAFGVLLQNPQVGGVATPLPAALLNSINNINFNNRLAVYAHLGTTSAQGYGIGIARIEQNGNDLFVTVRTKSPQPAEALLNTQSDAYVALDRTLLNMAAPIHIKFVDQNGTVLGNYTANAS